MLDITCDRCPEPLEEPGGLLFGPPSVQRGREVEKLHLCRSCYFDVREFIAMPWAKERDQVS